MRWAKSAARLAALAAALLIGADDSDGRSADGTNFGVGESGTFIRAPIAAAAVNRAGAYRFPVKAQVVPSYPGGSLSGLFNRGGILGGFAAGFLGSGLLGLLFGRGLFGGLGGVPSYLGLIFQIALLVMLCRLIWTRWRLGDAPGAATWSPRQLADPYLRSRDDLHFGIDSSDGNGDAAETDAPSGAHSSAVTEPHGRD